MPSKKEKDDLAKGVCEMMDEIENDRKTKSPSIEEIKKAILISIDKHVMNQELFDCYTPEFQKEVMDNVFNDLSQYMNL